MIFVTDPFFLPWEQVDKGAIRFVLSGANIMCPGLTSPGAKMTPVPKGTVVVSFFLHYKSNFHKVRLFT